MPNELEVGDQKSEEKELAFGDEQAKFGEGNEFYSQ